MAQPLEAWCTSCCTDDQYMYLKLVRQILAASFICAARKPTSSCMIVIVRLRLLQIGQRLWILRRTVQTKRLQRLARHHPRADRRAERLGLERAERHVFPLLDVARARPCSSLRSVTYVLERVFQRDTELERE